jgi:hypothetical protein
MADEKQIELVIRARNITDEAFKKVQAAIREIDSTSARTTSKGTTDWQRWFATIGGGVATGNLLHDAFKKVGAALIDLPNKLLELGARGADVNDVAGAFDGLTTSVGSTSEAMLGQLRTAFGGTIADFDLMKSANEGLSKGVQFTANDMGILGKAARVMADRVGGDAKQSFDAMIDGIAEGREKALKQLPLNFANITQSVEDYARSLRKEASELSESQKQEALRQAVLKESQRILAESGPIENDFADKVAAGAATVRNWTDSLAQSVAQYGPMIAGMGGMAQAASTLTPLLGMSGLAGAASTLAGVLLSPAGLVAGLTAAAAAYTYFKVSAIEGDTDALRQASEIMGRLVVDVKEAKEIIDAFNAGKAGASMGDRKVTFEMKEAWEKGAAAAGQLKDAVTSLTIGAFRPHLATLKELEEAKRKQEQIDKRIFDQMRAFADREADREKAGRQMVAALREEVEAHRQQLEVLPPLIEHYGHLTPAVEDTRSGTERMADALRKAASVMGGEFATAQAKAKTIIDQARDAIERENAAIEKGLNFGSRLSQTIIGALQGGGDVGKSVGGFIGGEAGNWAGKGIAGALAKSLPKELAGAIGGLAGPLGAIGGQLIGGLVDKLFGHKGRDMVKEFADSFGGFNGLQKKLQDTFDPQTAEKYWRALTQGVGRNNPQQAKQVIDAVTQAIQQQEAALNKTPRSFADASAAAEALGLDINRIGDGINQLRVHDDAEAIAAQWQILKDAGADMSQVAEGAAGKFQKMVDEALIWGHELPESMREPLQQMADMGLLTDKSGEKLEDLTGIRFAKPIEDSLGRIADGFDKLLGKLDRFASGLAGLPSDVDVNVNTHENSDGGAEASHAVGAYIREDHVAKVHAGELIGPVDFMARVLKAALPSVSLGGGGGGTVIVQFMDREVVRGLMPALADEVLRLKLA